jgi:hypothetical protein
MTSNKERTQHELGLLNWQGYIRRILQERVPVESMQHSDPVGKPSKRWERHY